MALIRYVVDIPGETADEISKLVQSGKYRSIQDFLFAAASNQLHIERQSTAEVVIDASRSQSIEPSGIVGVRGEKLEYQLLAPAFGKVQTVAPPDPSQVADELYGLWNKFFPVKITVRVLANILKGDGAHVPLDSLQERAADVARKLGGEIKRKERDLGRKRGDMISTALPWKRDEFKAKARFKTHFVGYLSNNRIEGVSENWIEGEPAALRFVNIMKHDGASVIGLTAAGLNFAELTNPVIDKEDYSRSLSLPEKQFLATHLKVELPKEARLMKSVLQWIRDGATNPTAIHARLQQMHPKMNDTELVTLRSGLLSRMVELNLMVRTRKGLSVSYDVTEEALDFTKGE
jgi:hypothetical protein